MPRVVGHPASRLVPVAGWFRGDPGEPAGATASSPSSSGQGRKTVAAGVPDEEHARPPIQQSTVMAATVPNQPVIAGGGQVQSRRRQNPRQRVVATPTSRGVVTSTGSSTNANTVQRSAMSCSDWAIRRMKPATGRTERDTSATMSSRSGPGPGYAETDVPGRRRSSAPPAACAGSRAVRSPC